MGVTLKGKRDGGWVKGDVLSECENSQVDLRPPSSHNLSAVILGLVPRIHNPERWVLGSSPRMTAEREERPSAIQKGCLTRQPRSV
ncbi:hypothetical protein BS627_04915 [Agrobacterium salinitolerans]|nr:hypothetical protein BS627_04915 [Agrobacterium salinitolerans]PNQ24572.1 hypothetical protein C2E26_04995 [Rhizobium sp. YIC5082]